jgi:hypothetical protein
MSAYETHAAADPAATAAAAAYPRRWLAAVVMIGAALMDMIDLPQDLPSSVARVVMGAWSRA